MRQIKFRGVDAKGNAVYGDLIQRDGKVLIHERSSVAAKYVKPESVAQLVGFDKNGKEIYEGDWCLDEDGKEFKAVFEPAFFATSTLKT